MLPIIFIDCPHVQIWDLGQVGTTSSDSSWLTGKAMRARSEMRWSQAGRA